VWGKGSSVMEDARVRRAGSFGAGAAAYERGRPGYPVEALRACLPEHARRVLDLGAGTGKLTRGLLDLGLDVAAVEPLEEMRALIPSEAQTLAGSAEAVPLPDACVDAVLVGQAFHWFDHDRALAEIARVLSPAGTVGLLWNLLDDAVPWVAAVADAFCAEDRASLAAGSSPPWTGVRGLSDPERRLIRHYQPSDAEQLVENVASRSTIILAGVEQRAAVLRRVRDLAPPGRFELPYLCDVWHARRTT